MSMPPTLLRPRDGDAVRAALRDLAALGEVPILFGGPVYDDTLLLTEFVGTRTGNLRGLAVQPSSGLGGATMVAGRPMSVADYRHAVSITHDYDGPVLSEGIRAVLAVPVLVDGRTRAVLYGAHRSSAPFGGRTADRMVAVARSLGEELRIRDEVDRRMRLHETHTTTGGVAAGAEQIREARRTASSGRRVAVAVAGAVARHGRPVGPSADRHHGRHRVVDVPRTRRAGPGGPRLHQQRGGSASFAEARDGQGLPAQRGRQARRVDEVRVGVQGAPGRPAPVGQASDSIQERCSAA